MLQNTLQVYRESFSGLRREVWYLSIVLLINRTGSMVIPFLTVYLTSQRGFSLVDAGLIMSSFGVGSVVGSYVGGWITDRFGFYHVQQWTLIGSGFLFWIVGQQDTFWEISLSIFALSTVTDAFRPANQTALAFYSDPENRPRAYGLLRLAVNLGFSLGPLLAGVLIAGLGYDWLFIVNGLSCLFAATAFRLLLPPGRQKEEREEKDVSEDGLSAYLNIPFIIFIFFLMLGAVAFMQFFSSLPIYLKDHLGYTETQIGGLIAINGIMIVAIEMPLIHKMGQRFKSLPLIAIGNVLLGVGFGLLHGAVWMPVFALFFIIFITMGEMLSMPFASTYTASVAPESRRGEYMGLYNISWAVAFIVAPSLGLWWAGKYGFSSLYWFSAAIGLLGGVGIFVLHKYQSRNESKS